MATIAENLQTIQNIKQDIKTAIENKGVDMSNTPFTEYSTKIDEITTGGGDTTTYSYKTPTADVEGLKALGWDDESIGYFRDNNLCYEWQKDKYIVTEGNKELYGVVTKNNISTYKSDPNFVYCPMIDTSNATNLNRLFYQCSSLKSIPLLDTSNANYLGELFSECSSLLTIPLLDCGNANNLNRLFHNCSSLQSIPPLNTSNANFMGELFRGCSSLLTIPLLDCGNATNMNNMFNGCSLLQSIPELDTGNATNMNSIFYGCSKLTTIPELNTGNVTNMAQMFYGCSKLTTIPELNTGNVTNMSQMFGNCSSLATIPELNTGNVTYMTSMFIGCLKLTSLPRFNVPNLTNISTYFGYSNITTLTDVGGWVNLKLNWNDNYGLAKIPNLTYQSCINILNGLYDFVGNGETPTSSQGKLKVHSNFLTTVGDEISIGTNKGWTITA